MKRCFFYKHPIKVSITCSWKEQKSDMPSRQSNIFYKNEQEKIESQWPYLLLLLVFLNLLRLQDELLQAVHDPIQHPLLGH